MIDLSNRAHFEMRAADPNWVAIITDGEKAVMIPKHTIVMVSADKDVGMITCDDGAVFRYHCNTTQDVVPLDDPHYHAKLINTAQMLAKLMPEDNPGAIEIKRH